MPTPIIILISVMTTLAVAFPAGYYANVWIPRHVGTHSAKDRNYSIDVLIEQTKNKISADEQAHRDTMDSLNTAQIPAPRIPDPDVVDDDTRLISSGEQPTLLCGDYGGRVPGPQWPAPFTA